MKTEGGRGVLGEGQVELVQGQFHQTQQLQTQMKPNAIQHMYTYLHHTVP